MIRQKFEKLTWGDVCAVLREWKRIDLEKWYKGEADYYKPLFGNAE